MKKAIFCFAVLAVLSGCKETDIMAGLPTCIEEKIAEFKTLPKKNPPAEIWQYTYYGKKVYYIAPSCCDIPSLVLDQNCNVLCSPDGGITGSGDGKCRNFFAEAKNKILVWEDPR